MGCTTLLVGKGASLDGSTIIARNEDSSAGEYNPKRMCVVHPEEQPRTYVSVLSHVSVELPDDPMRYTALPDALPGHGNWSAAGVNEANVAMTATETITSNPRVLGADPLVALVPAKGVPGEEGFVPERPGGIGEEDMVTLVLPYIHSAREGVERLGRLLEEHGTYEMNGIAFSDVDAVWWLETVGGHHWIARRVPDDACVVMPNQLGIDFFDVSDALGEQEGFMCSADIVEFIEGNHLGWLQEETDDEADDPSELRLCFDPREAFGSRSDADHVYNTPRAWDMLRFLAPDCLGGGCCGASPEDDDLPWACVPSRPVSIEDVKYVESLHYQGTPYDPYGRHGDGSQRGMYRPIGINRNGELAVIELRPWAGEATRAVEWVAFASNVFNVLVPLFADVDDVPEYLSCTSERVSTDSLYWQSRLIAALADAHFASCSNIIERYQDGVAAKAREIVGQTTRKVDEAGMGYADAAPLLAEANAEICAMVREETDDALSKVLYAASEGMRNGFARSDA